VISGASTVSLIFLALSGCSAQLHNGDQGFESTKVAAGEVLNITGTVETNNTAFTGIKIKVRTSGSSLIPLTEAAVMVRDPTPPYHQKSFSPHVFSQVGTDTYEATISDFECTGNPFSLTIQVPTVSSGSEQLEIAVAPINNPKGAMVTTVPIAVKGAEVMPASSPWAPLWQSWAVNQQQRDSWSRGSSINQQTADFCSRAGESGRINEAHQRILDSQSHFLH
jgi:hypothetical protein